MAASKALSACLSDQELRSRQTLPSIEKIREVSVQVALAVAIEARELGLGLQEDDEALSERIAAAMWQPHYLPYRCVKR